MDKADAELASRAENIKRWIGPWFAGTGLKPELLAMCIAWKDPAGHFAVACKGAPEAIIDLCHLTDEKAARIIENVEAMAERACVSSACRHRDDHAG